MAKLGFGIRKNAAFLIWLLLCILAIIVPPVVIMILYSVDRNKPFLVTPWSAGEMLLYCGVFGAAVIAIFGVYWSLRTDRQAQERLIREESAPFLQPSFWSKRTKDLLLVRSYATQTEPRTLKRANMAMPPHLAGKNTTKWTQGNFMCFWMKRFHTRQS